jgi:O-antigen/teichoic acid export membrane protein
MSLSRNLVANALGGGWVALNSVIFIPFYLRILGAESFGLIGVFTSLVALLALMDMGLSPAMNREMSRLSALHEPQLQANTARTIELTYWLSALLVGTVVLLLASSIAGRWLNPAQLERAQVERAIEIMALVIAVRWPIAMYTGGLNGLQKQGQLNLIVSVMATVQGGGALLVIAFWMPTIEAFFLWQAAAVLLQVLVLRQAFWRSLPAGKTPPRFDIEVVRSVWRFAAGVSGIALLATLLTQLDKLVLSRLLSLENFGYYMFATTVASLVLRLIAPVFTAYYPRLTERVARQEPTALRQDYQLSSQIVAALVLPVGGLLVMHPHAILMVWTSDTGLSTQAAALVAVLSLGNALNALMNMPYALQLAHGRTRLGVQMNLASVVFVLPAVYLASNQWGGLGAAWAWVALNLTYLTIGIPLMHRDLLPDQKWRWYARSVLGPLSGLAVGLALGYPLVGLAESRWQIFGALAVAGLLATAGAVLGGADLRQTLADRLHQASLQRTRS